MLLDCSSFAVLIPLEEGQDILIEPAFFNQEEIRIEVHKLKSGKAPGVCNITCELLKTCDSILGWWLHRFSQII